MLGECVLKSSVLLRFLLCVPLTDVKIIGAVTLFEVDQGAWRLQSRTPTDWNRGTWWSSGLLSRALIWLYASTDWRHFGPEDGASLFLQSKYYFVQQYRILISAFISSWRSHISTSASKAEETRSCESLETSNDFHVAVKTADPIPGTVKFISYGLWWGEITCFSELLFLCGRNWGALNTLFPSPSVDEADTDPFNDLTLEHQRSFAS
jgi:hypothetical protein